MVHDYSYQSVVFDYLPIPNDGSLDEVIKKTSQKKGQPQASNKLDEKDQVWAKYKNMHIAEVVGGINEDVTQMAHEQAMMRKIS